MGAEMGQATVDVVVGDSIVAARAALGPAAPRRGTVAS